MMEAEWWEVEWKRKWKCGSEMGIWDCGLRIVGLRICGIATLYQLMDRIP